ncbi:MAG: Flp pilus assembly complex ATPase component TadA [Deltaproteobacteria bacterium]|nr:Flp pilus assembly complex ATPase component TadA [Deltaproteobacteria bacterium]MBW2151875.1 Flp pilus assembly complex ATPase component TadA [Deltaproteobacteria bacterium]
MIISGKTGQLLIEEGLVRQEDIEAALQIQRKEAGGAPPRKAAPRTIGQILCDLNLITPFDLHRVLKKYRKQLRLGELLVRKGVVEAGAVEEALLEQQKRFEPLGDILVKNQKVGVEQLYKALSCQYNIAYRNVKECICNDHQIRDLTRIVDMDFAKNNLVVPLSLEESRLTLALCYPEKISCIQQLSNRFPYLRIQCVLVFPECFCRLFTQLYHVTPKDLPNLPEQRRKVNKALCHGESSDENPLPESLTSDSLRKMNPNGEASEIVAAILKYGMMNKASSIHIEQDFKGTIIRYRLQSTLQPLKLPWDEKKVSEMADAVIDTFKQMAGLSVKDKKYPQSGLFHMEYFIEETAQREQFDIRVSTCPVPAGENVTLTLSNTRAAIMDLDKLAHSPRILTRFKRVLEVSRGLILLSAPAGNGLCETMEAAVSYLCQPAKKVIAIQDHIRRSIAGVVQIEVNPVINLSCTHLLQNIFNHDADVVMVGRIKEKEEARWVFDLAMADHLVLAGLRGQDAIDALVRLSDFGIEPDRIVQCLKAVFSQRRIRKLCPTCKQPYIPEPKEWEPIFEKYPSHLHFFKPKGCNECGSTGYQGHMYISEILQITPRIVEAFYKGTKESQLRGAAFQSGMRFMADDACSKLNQTSLAEVVRALPWSQAARSGPAVLQIPLAEEGSHDIDDRCGTASRRWEISCFETDQYLVHEMWQYYRLLNMQQGKPERPFEESLFRRYILESFRRICRSTGCNSVTFIVERGKGQAELSALPGLKSSPSDHSA